jgi:G6PDH family F420-dependent oxidoreductase
MYPGRFWMAAGSGEALNESITGDHWPAKGERNARLAECVEIMRALWAGETVSRCGRVRIARTRLYSRPAAAPPIFAAALSVDTARWAGEWADGLITIAGPADSMRRIVEAFREGGGAGKPLLLQVALSWAPTQDEAAHAAYDQWRQCTLPADVISDLEQPEDFDRHTEHTKMSDVIARIRTSCDVEQHLAWLHEDAQLGFDRIYLHNVARMHQERFIEACATRLLPQFR